MGLKSQLELNPNEFSRNDNTEVSVKLLTRSVFHRQNDNFHYFEDRRPVFRTRIELQRFSLRRYFTKYNGGPHDP